MLNTSKKYKYINEIDEFFYMFYGKRKRRNEKWALRYLEDAFQCIQKIAHKVNKFKRFYFD